MAACNMVACKVTTAFNNTSWFAQQLQHNEPSGNHGVSYNTTTLRLWSGDVLQRINT